MTYQIELNEDFLNFAYQSLTEDQKYKCKVKYIITKEIDKAPNKQERIKELAEEFSCSFWTLSKWYYKNK